MKSTHRSVAIDPDESPHTITFLALFIPKSIIAYSIAVSVLLYPLNHIDWLFTSNGS